MSEAFLGEIRMFAGVRPPANWQICNGAVLPIAGNQALYALIGVAYGGDGVSTFAIPDLQGRIPIGVGTGTGLTARTLAQKDGQEQVALATDQIPSHNHELMAAKANATLQAPGNALFAITASSASTVEAHYLKPGATISNTWTLKADSVASTGNGAAHENRMVTAGMNFIICLNGYFPDFS